MEDLEKGRTKTCECGCDCVEQCSCGCETCDC
jgi:hypothetical protein